MTLDFAKEIMSVPACSRHEDFLVECIEKWCGQNGVKTEVKQGNLYLTKGHTEWFPCLAAHLDTVQDKQAEYADKKKLLDVKVDGDKLYVDGMGIGADCRAGIAICLDAMTKIPACKCVFFSNEELGCQGAQKLDKGFFDDVSYCIEWDSPTWNRAAKSSMGADLFTQEFFDKYIKDVAKKYGVTDFRDEPGTDVHFIVKYTGTTCMNFSNGGYKPHSPDEYCLFSEMDKGSKFCVDLVKTIPNDKKYKIEFKMKMPDWMRRPPPGRWSAPPGSGKWVNGKPVAVQPEFDFGGPRKKGGKKEKDVSIAVQFDVPGIADDFVQEIAERGIPVELDDDGLEIIITGRRKDVQEAYAVWARYDSEDDSIAGWKDLDKPYVDGFEADVMEDPVASFSGDDEPVDVEPIDVDSAPDPDDPSYDELAGDPDAEDFWSWFESRR
jgi:hypothetical protein